MNLAGARLHAHQGAAAIEIAFDVMAIERALHHCGSPKWRSIDKSRAWIANLPALSLCKTGSMLRLLRLLFVLIKQSFCTRSNLLLENMALRQQLAVLKRRYPRPRIATLDKLFWVILRRFWPRWKHALILLHPDTVVRWHRAGFALYWKWLSRYRNRAGRKCVSRKLRELILRMVTDHAVPRQNYIRTLSD
jgi:hypothetical protein